MRQTCEKKREEKERDALRSLRENQLPKLTHTLFLNLSLSLTAFSASVHMCGWQRRAQELKMSELTKPYLKIARFCK